eukprot:6485105-Amphidinium_carterae.1
MLLVCGGIFLSFAALQLTRKTLPMYGKLARARSAWCETCQQQNRLLLASCVLLPSYGNMLLLACMVVADHVRALSRQTCGEEFVAYDESTEKARIIVVLVLELLVAVLLELLVLELLALLELVLEQLVLLVLVLVLLQAWCLCSCYSRCHGVAKSSSQRN